MLGQRDRPLGDVHRQIGDPLQLGVDLEHRRRAPQIDGHRLMQGENLEALLLDLHLADVDLELAGGHLGGDVRAALDQRLAGLGDHLLDARRLVEDFALQGLQDRVLNAST